jgi:glyoxylase-like metal-dependent hydrolase (beta-lactamase superfamily II)
MDKIYCKKIFPYLALIRIPYLSISKETAFVNNYLIMDKELLLIDAGPWRKNYRDTLSSILNQFGFSIKDISRIIYTHPHPDHMGGGIELNSQYGLSHSIYWEAQEQVEHYGQFVSLLKSLSKEIFSKHLFLYPLEKDIYFGVIDSYWNPTFGKIEIDHGLREEEVIDTGKLKLEIIFTPGHSPWDISLWEEKKSILFSGDFLMRKSTTLIGGLKGLGSDLKAYESSLKKIKKYLLKAKFVFPSHGPSITSCSNLADNLSKIIKKRENRILKKLSMKKHTLIDLTNSLFSSNCSSVVLVRQLGVVLTHLEKLEREGKVICSKDGNKIFYELS